MQTEHGKAVLSMLPAKEGEKLTGEQHDAVQTRINLLNDGPSGVVASMRNQTHKSVDKQALADGLREIMDDAEAGKLKNCPAFFADAKHYYKTRERNKSRRSRSRSPATVIDDDSDVTVVPLEEKKIRTVRMNSGKAGLPKVVHRNPLQPQSQRAPTAKVRPGIAVHDRRVSREYDDANDWPLDLTWDDEPEGEPSGESRHPQPAIDKSDFPVGLSASRKSMSAVTTPGYEDDLDLDLTLEATSNSSSSTLVKHEKVDKPKTGNAYTDSGAVRSTLFGSIPEGVRTKMESFEGKQVEFVIENKNDLATGTCFVESIDVFADPNAPAYVLGYSGYVRCSYLQPNLTKKKKAKDTQAEKDVKKGLAMRLGDGIVTRSGKKVDTFQEAIDLQESVYIWSDYLRQPLVEAVKLIPPTASKTADKTAAGKTKTKSKR